MTNARAQRAQRVERMAEEQRACAFDFLVNGDELGIHAKRCVWPKYGQPACSREYDPGPPPENERLYEGTELMTLWTNTRRSYTLAGWNIKLKRSEA